MNKLFIIGLPRTGTTSVSAALLDGGLKVAHTALTKESFKLADAISDTPCFCDYRQLDQLFPGSKFVYLDRDIKSWIPSIRMLLTKMQPYLDKPHHFNPVLKRCFTDTFELKNEIDTLSDAHLSYCYQNHQHQVFEYFSKRKDLLRINIKHKNSLSDLCSFIKTTTPTSIEFPHLNSGRMITAWKDIKHPNKIDSNASGKDRRKFLDY
ncbi:sulfotransferase [Marinicella rhabdoformis]|uniref:sulfotransferase n=1 Tax=Marinicella rhabdoformis TaxID=2580566 RepID=UPI0012AEC790|nr:sulfotransferase [Marinicella rhabdoformis]